jgi:hypothetical protein
MNEHSSCYTNATYAKQNFHHSLTTYPMVLEAWPLSSEKGSGTCSIGVVGSDVSTNSNDVEIEDLCFFTVTHFELEHFSHRFSEFSMKWSCRAEIAIRRNEHSRRMRSLIVSSLFLLNIPGQPRTPLNFSPMPVCSWKKFEQVHLEVLYRLY